MISAAWNNWVPQMKYRRALKAVGMHVNSIYDLVNSTGDYPAAIPVLIQLLSQVETPKIKEQVVRALGVKSAKRVAEKPLIKNSLVFRRRTNSTT